MKASVFVVPFIALVVMLQSERSRAQEDAFVQLPSEAQIIFSGFNDSWPLLRTQILHFWEKWPGLSASEQKAAIRLLTLWSHLQPADRQRLFRDWGKLKKLPVPDQLSAVEHVFVAQNPLAQDALVSELPHHRRGLSLRPRISPDEPQGCTNCSQ